VKLRLLVGLAATLLIGVLALLGRQVPLEPRPPAQRPTLALLTSLPLMFGESFGLASGGSPALTALEQRYNVQPIGVADAPSLAGQKLLLMAHPRAQPAQALVELDRWVRDGGRLLLLADPKLDWDSGRPLGDRFRPPPDFADTGLLAHWGITLSGPVEGSSAGRLAAKKCGIAGQGLIARCRIGKGAVTVVADADFLNVQPSAEPKDDDLGLLVDELDRLESL
jgi:hypothetical protein